MKEQLKSLAETLVNTVKSGKLYTDKETVEERRKICNGCPMRSGRKCRKCSCNIFVATMIHGKKCPLGKW